MKNRCIENGNNKGSFNDDLDLDELLKGIESDPENDKETNTKKEPKGTKKFETKKENKSTITIQLEQKQLQHHSQRKRKKSILHTKTNGKK